MYRMKANDWSEVTGFGQKRELRKFCVSMRSDVVKLIVQLAWDSVSVIMRLSHRISSLVDHMTHTSLITHEQGLIHKELPTQFARFLAQ